MICLAKLGSRFSGSRSTATRRVPDGPVSAGASVTSASAAAAAASSAAAAAASASALAASASPRAASSCASSSATTSGSMAPSASAMAAASAASASAAFAAAASAASRRRHRRRPQRRQHRPQPARARRHPPRWCPGRLLRRRPPQADATSVKTARAANTRQNFIIVVSPDVLLIGPLIAGTATYELLCRCDAANLPRWPSGRQGGGPARLPVGSAGAWPPESLLELNPIAILVESLPDLNRFSILAASPL